MLATAHVGCVKSEQAPVNIRADSTLLRRPIAAHRKLVGEDRSHYSQTYWVTGIRFGGLCCRAGAASCRVAGGK
ncbi:hypothetical protein XF_2744 [Xylella fastidiosa 9a5c]|uniref:Uncharacterized protein n=1 Tax=Xylella fastidiosa (strain 9a5c) TaxID=160492 RepID=Q9P9X6_XYLFA|nr:hypothetical protein XF_2744 [Xylella fastidiosa 9a5c]